MSDNIKIVIEIPKDRYTDILRIADIQIVRRMPTLEQVVANGTPLSEVLDEIKAEIKKNILDEPVENGTNAEMACYDGGLLKCLEIIDKHIGKAESEE